MNVLCNSEFSWRSGSRLNTLTITAGAQHSEETHTHREPLHTFIWTQARCCTHAETLFESLRHMGYCCTCLVGWTECWPLIGWKKNPVVNNNKAIRDAHPAGWISGAGLCCHVQLWTLNSHGQTCVKQTGTEGWIDELPCLPKLLIKINKTLCSGPFYRLLFSCKRLKKSTWVAYVTSASWPNLPIGLLTIPISTDCLLSTSKLVCGGVLAQYGCRRIIQVDAGWGDTPLTM